MADLVKTFAQKGDFAAMRDAENFLELAGFSYGRMQRGDPRGILYGEYDISKWRNMDAQEREQLDGHMTGDMRTGPIEVRIFEKAAAAAKREFHETAIAAAHQN